jgi:hypothetical protein
MATNDRNVDFQNDVIDETKIQLDNSSDLDFQPDRAEEHQEDEREDDNTDQESPDQDYDQEPEPDEEQYEEEPIKKPKHKERDRTRERLNEIQREKYQALDENVRLKSENQRLQQLAEMSSNSASIHYENSVKQRLEHAKNLKRAAKEVGDVNSEIEADIELAAAVSQQNQLESWKAEREVERHYPPAPANPIPQPNYNRPEVVEWARRNQWMSADSRDYDPHMAQKAEAYANQLDNYCIQQGRLDWIGSSDYFYKVDEFVANTRAQSATHQRANTQQRGQLNMRQSRSGVSAVKTGNGQTGRREEAQLSTAERDLARRLGITEQQYRQSKKDIKKRGE